MAVSVDCGRERVWKRGTSARAGSVLVLALWTLFFLSALAVAVNARVNGLMRFTRALRDDRAAYEAARAGADHALMALAELPAEWDGLMNDEARFRDVSVDDARFSVIYRTPLADGSMAIGYGVIGEESKVNVNKAGRELLAALLRGAGGLDSGAADTLARRILAERGEPDTELTNGASAHYYGDPIQGRDREIGPFASLHELLLVPGMSPDTFERVRHYATLYGTGKINVNAAPRAVLLALADSSRAGDAAARESLVRRLIRFREAGQAFETASETGIRKALEQGGALSAGERTVLRAMLAGATLQSSHFSGEAQGWTGALDTEEGRAMRRIAFVLDRQRMARVDWHEQ